MSELKRAAIVGTAPTWIETPWDDPDLTICTLNDGYSLGIKRTSEHYDLHPISKMWFRPAGKTVFKESEIPEGAYIRPEKHLDWLKTTAKTCPVWLQDEPPDDWPAHARRFPFEQVKAFLKARPDQDAYVASSPAMMLAHLILRGFTEVSIYGIHLATDGEYIKQRPGFEWLLGRAEAMGITILLPKDCPLLKHTHVYGYEPEPKRPDLAAQKRLAKANRQYSTLAASIIKLPSWKVRTKAALMKQLTRVKAEIKDAQMQARHDSLSAVG